MKFLAALSLALLFATAVSPQQKRPFEPEYLSVFYYLPASGVPVELERQIPKETVRGGRIQFSIPGEKSPVRIAAGNSTEFVVRAAETFKVAVSTLQLFRLDSEGGIREFFAPRSTNIGRGIKLNAEPYGSFSLKVAPVQPLAPGEYCLSRTTALPGFCFGIDPAVEP